MSLRPQVPLHRRLEQVTERRDDRHHQAQSRRLARRPRVDRRRRPPRPRSPTESSPPGEPLPGLVGADRRAPSGAVRANAPTASAAAS